MDYPWSSAAAASIQLSKVEQNDRSIWRLIARIIRKHIDNIREPSNVLTASDVVKCRVATLTRDDLLRIFRYLHDHSYSPAYQRSIWTVIHPHNNAISSRELIEIQRAMTNVTECTTKNATKTVTNVRNPTYATDQGVVGTRSRKSDGRLTFTEREYDIMLRRCEHDILHNSGSSSFGGNRAIQRHHVFLYVFYMLARTGKRLSDIAEITPLQLEQLCQRGVCVIKIRKTRKLGRIEIPEILLPADGRTERERERSAERGTENRVDCVDVKNMYAVCRILEIFLDWVRIERTLIIPFDVQEMRRHLDKELASFYRVVTNRPKPKGLSFHALRRIYAGYLFLQGTSIERLRENLDHVNRKQTNRYVNSCLYEIINKET